MSDLLNLIDFTSSDTVIASVVCLALIVEFIGCVFTLIGRMK